MSKTKGIVLLIHDFQGAESNFADETSCTVCDSRAQAVAEVIEGLQIVQGNNAGYFEPMSPRKVQAHFKKSRRLQIVSKDNCVYTWAIVEGNAIKSSQLTFVDKRRINYSVQPVDCED